jgi:hypothetical protein
MGVCVDSRMGGRPGPLLASAEPASSACLHQCDSNVGGVEHAGSAAEAQPYQDSIRFQGYRIRLGSTVRGAKYICKTARLPPVQWQMRHWQGCKATRQAANAPSKPTMRSSDKRGRTCPEVCPAAASHHIRPSPGRPGRRAPELPGRWAARGPCAAGGGARGARPGVNA